MTASLYQTGYDTGATTLGLVHVGYGAFHRAHQAVYLDDYMEATGDLRWGIGAINLRPSESQSFADAAGSGPYVLKSIAPDGEIAYRAVRAHTAFADASRDLEAALGLIARPGVKALSMTVTESGYAFKPDWSLDLDVPEIVADLAGGKPRTVYGFLAQALAARAQMDAPISLLCCDNIRSNGHVLQAALLAFLEAQERTDLRDWVTDNVTFPCSMVDRITPRSTDALGAEITRLFPDMRARPIHAEAFLQWVLQDDFATEFPDLSRVGVQIVADVEPFEEAKIRILNGGHTGLCYLGALAGHHTFDAAMGDPAIRDHFDRWEVEVLQGLEGQIPFDTALYRDEIAARFENAGIADQLARICMDGYSKMGLYIRPTLEACLTRGITPTAGYDCAASWVVYARKIEAGTMPVPYNEPFWATLVPLLARGQERALASDPQLWGALPRAHESFVPDLTAAIQRMDKTWQD